MGYGWKEVYVFLLPEGPPHDFLSILTYLPISTQDTQPLSKNAKLGWMVGEERQRIEEWAPTRGLAIIDLPGPAVRDS